MVLLLPEGFELAPADRVPEQMKRKLENYITNIVQNKEYFGCYLGMNITKWLFLSPDPSTNKRLII
jgi:hypothetical protein